jgi:hypothetical protein
MRIQLNAVARVGVFIRIVNDVEPCKKSDEGLGLLLSLSEPTNPR